MSETDLQLPTVSPAQALAPSNDEHPEAFVIEELASEGITPLPEGKPWRGRASIVTRVMEEFRLDKDGAEAAVDRAVKDLYEGQKERATNVQRQLLEARLIKYRNILLKAIASRDKGYEMTYQWEMRRNPDGTPMLDPAGVPLLTELPKRKTISKGFDPSAFKLLLDIEELIVRVQHLEEAEGNADALAQIFARLEGDSEGGQKLQAGVSVSQRIKAADISKLGKAGNAVLQRAITSKRKRGRPKGSKSRVKQVESREVSNDAEGNSGEHDQEGRDQASAHDSSSAGDAGRPKGIEED
jgi:hypothetical protein